MSADGADSLGREKSILRWGGLTGILGGIVFILVPVVQFGFVLPIVLGWKLRSLSKAAVDPGGNA